ncbi:kelch domain-containing protein 3 [Tetranychus urticae]|uniref:Kelch domain-containing protein n=1 Tax=Tetranychus urticae TaxID=32264 RepID=T1KHH6_TETUR|nr:kelch domain-containing protein 3 [Tetranychus urticae]
MLVLSKIGGGLKRVNHAAVAVDGHIYCFGGYLGTEDYSDERPIDVYALNMTTLRWEEIEYSDGGDPANVPFIRYGHSVVAQDNIIYLWGGRRKDITCNKLFMFDTDKRSWLATEVKGSIPGVRDGHTACIHDGFMYIFGGFEEGRQEFSDAVFRFELDSCTWTALPELTSNLLKKDYPSCVVINNRIYFFGGRSYSCPFYDSNILELDLTMMTLSTVDVVGFKPLGRRSHSAVVVNNKMIIFGGYNDITDEHFNDFAVFDPKTYEWESVIVRGGSPTPRRKHCCVAVNSYLYIFGGSCPVPQAPDAEAHSLMELDDLYVIDTSQSLRSMSLQVILDQDLDTNNLTTALQREIESYRTENDLNCTQLNKLSLKSDESST